MKTRGPKKCTEAELNSVGVTLADPGSGILHCNECGSGWAVNSPGAGHKLPKGYWVCPNGCNEPD